MYQLQRLMALVYIKNQLNNKRRRFYKLIRGTKSDSSNYPKINSTLTLEFCKEQYEKAKQDMKAMRRSIHLARKASGARTTRGEGGQYKSIVHLGRIYSMREIEFHYFQMQADLIILGKEK